jgi:regulator of replication initiation timing
LKRHIKNCKYIKAVEIERSKYEDEIKKLQEQLSKIKIEYEKQLSENNILQRELDKAQYMIQTLSETAINRPTTTTNEIGNVNNVKITNHLSDHKSYLRQIHPERVTELLHLHFEKYFMDGQMGLARFVVEHIIRLKDGKMILCCTDPTRKRFRFIDADGKLAEDLRAKMFRSKIKIPVKEMCNEVFDRIIERIKDEKKVKISSGESEAGMEIGFFEIRAFDGDDGTEFLNELASLLRNSYEVNDL